MLEIEKSIKAWTGLGCDNCGFGTIENVDEFDPMKPCCECGEVMIPRMSRGEFIAHIFDNLIESNIDQWLQNCPMPDMSSEDFKSLLSHVSDALIHLEPILETRLKQIIECHDKRDTV